MTGPIFGSSSGGSSNGRNLVEFRAGRMNMVGKMVHPDKRRGLLYVYQAEDMLIHFCWKDVTTGTVEDDLIIFPDDCEFKLVDQCKTGRVYLLKFKASNRRLFFWMQESKVDNDEDLCRRVNDSINNPPPQGGGGGSGGRGGGGGGTDSNDLQYMINNMSPQQLVQLFNGVNQMGGLNSIFGNRSSESNSRSSPGPAAVTGTTTTTSASSAAATATPTTGGSSAATPQAPRKGATTTRRPGSSSQDTPASTTSGAARTTPAGELGATGTGSDSNSVLLSELRSFLSGLGPEGGAAAAAGGATGSTNLVGGNVDFSTAITTDALNPLLNDNPDWIAQLEEHLPDVGTDDTKKQQLRDTISSPQFQQALGMFSSALQSGQLGPVVSQFKLSTEAVEAANLGDLEKFVRALENSAKEVSQGGAGKAAKGGSGSLAEGGETAASKNKDDDQEDDHEMQG